ncbi:MAG: helix-turn-helix transcriptional regulator [Bacteroidales bacterium]|nr:helix-turn-helix transcriptional regulator [Bacteroidales bacterium]
MKIPNTAIQQEIINKIKELRLQHGISQVDLADILCVSYGHIGNIESLKFQHKYTIKQLYSFCVHIGYPIEKLFLSDIELLESNHIELLIKKIIEYDE